MKKFTALILLCLFTLPVFAKDTILIIGDSLSAGYGMDPNQGWVTLLRNKLKQNGYDYDVINSSISGNTTSQGLASLSPTLKRFNPKVTIVELGGNDGLRGLPLATIQSNLQQMIHLIKKANSHALLIGVRLPPNYGEAYTHQFQQIFENLGRQNQISTVTFFLKNIDENINLMQADRIHPNAKAQSIMLDNVWPSLEKLLNK